MTNMQRSLPQRSLLLPNANTNLSLTWKSCGNRIYSVAYILAKLCTRSFSTIHQGVRDAVGACAFHCNIDSNGKPFPCSVSNRKAGAYCTGPQTHTLSHGHGQCRCIAQTCSMSAAEQKHWTTCNRDAKATRVFPFILKNRRFCCCSWSFVVAFCANALTKRTWCACNFVCTTEFQCCAGILRFVQWFLFSCKRMVRAHVLAFTFLAAVSHNHLHTSTTIVCHSIWIKWFLPNWMSQAVVYVMRFCNTKTCAKNKFLWIDSSAKYNAN